MPPLLLFLLTISLTLVAESLGGVESLAELPFKMTHAGVNAEKRRELGIDGELVRLSVGVEDGEDLVDDVERALRAAVLAN
jgi:cystathionine gamma-lyase